MRAVALIVAVLGCARPAPQVAVPDRCTCPKPCEATDDTARAEPIPSSVEGYDAQVIEEELQRGFIAEVRTVDVLAGIDETLRSTIQTLDAELVVEIREARDSLAVEDLTSVVERRARAHHRYRAAIGVFRSEAIARATGPGVEFVLDIKRVRHALHDAAMAAALRDPSAIETTPTVFEAYDRYAVAHAKPMVIPVVETALEVWIDRVIAERRPRWQSLFAGKA